LIQLIQQEAEHAKAGKPSGIVIKINSLQDKESIDALYVASQAGVPIHLVVRGMCCLRPGIKGLSDNITVRSLIGDFLEHTRIYYFHNAGQPKVYGGSADMMVRSFDRRIESLFLISDPLSLKMAIHILKSNLLDNVNAYELLPNDNYIKVEVNADAPVNVHQLFFTTTKQEVESVRLF
jgi:polyphosphate kinase